MSELYGLVLAGGESRRMGRDKAWISYHGVPQWAYMYELISSYTSRTFISVPSASHFKRLLKELGKPLDVEVNTEQMIEDVALNLGPMNGIISAHLSFPEAAWLVVAVDLPLLHSGSLAQLLQCRDIEKEVSAFLSPTSGLPEPLCAIWEAKGLRHAYRLLNQGDIHSLMDVLQRADIHHIIPSYPEALFNANRPEDYDKALNILAHGSLVRRKEKER